MPPVAPMLAKAADELPEGDGWLYEPKWDGFRCIVFRDGDEVELGSRNERPLTRYFPEVVAAVKTHAARSDASSTARSSSPARPDSTSTRCSSASIRPTAACSKLADETPASFVAFDLLAIGDRDLTEMPLSERRATLEQVATTRPPIFVTPISS